MNDRHQSTTSAYYHQPQSTHYYNINTSQRPHYDTNTLFNFESDQPLFDFQAKQYCQSSSQPPMHSDRSWFSNGQLTPTSTTRAHHHRESSLSSLGSAGPASPFNATTSNPQVAGEVYHDYNDFHPATTKPLTPIHTPSQEHFLTPQYTHYYQNASIPFGMSHEGQRIKSEHMPAPDFNNSGRRSIATSVASNDSPSTPPAYEDERQKHGEISIVDFWANEYLQVPDDLVYRNAVPKLERTMTDIYSDELYNPNFTISAAPQTSVPAPIVTVSPHHDVFSQRLQAANNQHLNASNSQLSTTIPPRDKSPFRQGSPLAPVANSFQTHSQGLRFNTATQMREQQKAEADARALQQQIERSSPSGVAQTTISPKDVDLVYHETEEDRNTPLFPTQQIQPSPVYRHQPIATREQTESDDNASQQSFGSMATSRRESSAAFSGLSGSQQQSNFTFTPPAVPGGIRLPQQYPFIPQSRRQPSNLSNVTEDFPATLTSMESSSSEYGPESSESKKPAGTSADTGTYTCTYHGCPLRFDTPAKLQRHKREGHRNSNSIISSGDESGMTAAANRNSQAGPHKCERVNPSTGKPCNTIFSRPYDLTRHEDTIHNARKQKVYCPICTEEKSFSRNDALTRHMRVVHPQYADQSSRRRRGGS